MVHRAPMRGAVEQALARGVVGIAATDERRVARFGAVPEGAYVWTRDGEGSYWLGRIAGPLRASDGALAHVRDADWLDRPFGEPEVPAGVAATFARGGRNFQRTHGAEVERRTAELWDAEGGESVRARA